MTIIVKIITGLISIVFIVIAGWLAAPLFYDKTVNETFPTATQDQITDQSAITLASGGFTGADNLHQGRGTARLIQIDGKHYLRFEDDFNVTNGPDLFVHFGNNGQYAAEANLGRLKGNVGAQNYEIPADIDPSLYNEIWIWCRAFSIPFAHALLQ